MKNVLAALDTQLTNYAGLSYANDSGYVSRNIVDLVQMDKYPFWNLVPGNINYVKVDNVPYTQLERIEYDVIIQFATHSMNMNDAILGTDDKTGILDFAQDIWSAVKSDRTLGGVVRGVTPGFTISYEILNASTEDEQYFIPLAETTIQFFNEGPV